MQDHNIVTVLPVFKGYTIDSRLKEFRRIEPDRPAEFIKFSSTKGSVLIEEISKTQPVPLVKIPVGQNLTGRYVGTFAVDWPLSNEIYGQAALKVDQQTVLITLPQKQLEKLRVGQSITLRGTKQGIVTVLPLVKSKELKP